MDIIEYHTFQEFKKKDNWSIYGVYFNPNYMTG